MKQFVKSVILADNKIFRPVVAFVFIDVMDDGIRWKVPSERSFRDENVLMHVPLHVCARMIFPKYGDVAFSVDADAPIPVVMATSGDRISFPSYNTVFIYVHVGCFLMFSFASHLVQNHTVPENEQIAPHLWQVGAKRASPSRIMGRGR